MWRSGDHEAVLADSERAKALAVIVRAESRAIRAGTRETVALARNYRQVGVLRRALQRRMAELAATRKTVDAA
jgi:hypothetical protein